MTVRSLLAHFLKSYVDGHERYEDRLSRWLVNYQGRDLLREHRQLAVDNRLSVHQVFATLDDPGDGTDADASAIPKTFSMNGELAGTVTAFDGDTFVIDFYPI